MRSIGALLTVFAFFISRATCVDIPNAGVDGGSHMEVELKSFSNCENYPSMPMMFKELQISQIAKKKFAINGGVDMNMTVDNEITAVISILQCEDSTSDDNCEFVGSVKGSKFCDKITKEGTPWYEFLKETDIGNKCPVEPGSYDFNEAPFEFSDAEGMPLTPGHWKIRMELYSSNFQGDPGPAGKEPFGCNLVEVSVSPSRALNK
ncbi:uncharacterized protein LOC124162121 [Ischnura elegans]|uniref:uncharacterized protein LOC124162121 n=1 Tax=Ischnura elegans TaxID=197161 RepID=UPI001ED8B3F5|nr:uncharacterized protein LOC124162121 [Ischnura elegans]